MKDKKFTHLKTRAEFIKRATEKHNGRFTYDNVVFPPRAPSKKHPNGGVRRLHEYDCQAYVFITCPDHGDFEQKARKHLEGVGCRYCAHEALSLPGVVIGRDKRTNFKEGHDYVDNGTTITINCIPSHLQLRQLIIDKEDEEILEYCIWRTTGHQNSRNSLTEYGQGDGTIRMKQEGLEHLGGHPKIHRLIMERVLGRKLKRSEHVDHIDNNGLNNRRSNLRLATPSQNHANKPKQRGSYSSKYKGVCFDKNRNKWHSSVNCRNAFPNEPWRKKINLGRFATEIEAAQAYDKKAKEIWGDFAQLNFPQKSST